MVHPRGAEPSFQITIQYAEQAYPYCLARRSCCQWWQWIQFHCLIILIHAVYSYSLRRVPSCAITGFIPPAERNLRFMGMMLNENVHTQIPLRSIHICPSSSQPLSCTCSPLESSVSASLMMSQSRMTARIIVPCRRCACSDNPRVHGEWFNSLFEIIHVSNANILTRH